MFTVVEVRGFLDILAKVKLNKQANKIKEREAKEKAYIDHVNLVCEAELIKEDLTKTNKAPKNLTIAQLRPLPKEIKRSGDKARPIIKAKMDECYKQWLDQPYLNPSQAPSILDVVAGAAVEEEENSSLINSQEDDNGNMSDEEEENDNNEMLLDQEV